MRSILFSLLLTCTAGVFAAPDPRGLPAPFDSAIPAALDGGPALVELKPRCGGCPPWRTIEFKPRRSKPAEKVEHVSVAEGYSALYAYPGMGTFANVKVERSVPGRYAEDRRIVGEALRYEYEQMQGAIDEAPPTTLLDERRAMAKAAGVDYMEWRTGSVRGIDYQAAVLNDVNAGTMGQVVFFDARRELIVTAYLLSKRPRNFTQLADYLPLQRAFIERYAAVLAGD
jgi:hypothetical protein